MCQKIHRFSLTAVRVHNKFEKVRTFLKPDIGIFGTINRLSHHNFNPTNGKSENSDSDMERFDQKPRTNLVGNNKLDSFTLLISPGCDAGTFTYKIPSTTTTRVYKKTTYQSVAYLNQNSIQELVWWVNKLEMPLK